MIAILNASPLIYLSKISAISLLPKLFAKCYTSKIVKTEVLSDINAPEHAILNQSFSSWLELKDPINKSLIKKLKELNIHSGEASVIALAKELQAKFGDSVIIIDDLAARDIARTLDLKVIGTIGVLLRSKNLKLITIEKCKDFLYYLVENTTFRISADLFTKILKEIEKVDLKKDT